LTNILVISHDQYIFKTLNNKNTRYKTSKKNLIQVSAVIWNYHEMRKSTDKRNHIAGIYRTKGKKHSNLTQLINGRISLSALSRVKVRQFAALPNKISVPKMKSSEIICIVVATDYK
jgi:hypothetical protein